MSFSCLRMRSRALFSFRSLVIGMLLWPASALAAPAESILVNVDQAKLVKLPGKVATIVVGRMIQVEGPTDQLVTIYRGVERESYSCMPICQRRVTLGDGATYFKAAMDQAG